MILTAVGELCFTSMFFFMGCDKTVVNKIAREDYQSPEEILISEYFAAAVNFTQEFCDRNLSGFRFLLEQ